jgi:RimJ/RimL family protein N-acetyltransferase
MFALELRASGELSGFAGLVVPQLLPEVMPAVEIGWRLGRAFWGRGLATEAAAGALRFGLIDGNLGQIISMAQVGDGASERIMGKLGMRLARETVDPPATDRSGSTRSPRRSTWRQAQGQTATARPGVT